MVAVGLVITPEDCHVGIRATLDNTGSFDAVLSNVALIRPNLC